MRPGRNPLHPMPLAADHAEADRANNAMGVWANGLLDEEPAVPPDMGTPQSGTNPGGTAPTSSSTATGSGQYTAQDDGDDSDVELDGEGGR